MGRLRATVGIVALLAVGGCTADGPGVTAAGTGQGETAGITARGLGTASGPPDTATVVLGVQTRGPSAQATLDANTTRATALIDLLRRSGVAGADVRTSGLSILPTYGPRGEVTGYEVSNIVTATLRDISGAGALIDAAAEAAGDAVRVQQFTFSLDDDSALRAQARADAVRRAQAQARQLADAAGVALGPIRSITEVLPPAPPVPFASDAGEARAVPIEPGRMQIDVLVDVVHAIDQ